MKIKLIMSASLLLVATAYTRDAQLGSPTASPAVGEENMTSKPLPAFSTLPDLVIISIKAKDLDSGEVSVKIKNQGQRNAARTDVKLSITYGSDPPLDFTRTTSGPLAPGATDLVAFDVKKSIVQASFCAAVDTLNKVAESNENNNKRCGKFGGKP